MAIFQRLAGQAAVRPFQRDGDVHRSADARRLQRAPVRRSLERPTGDQRDVYCDGGLNRTPPAISVSATRLSTASTITASVANGPAKPTDWIGLFDVEANASSYLTWWYLNGSTTPPAAGLADASLRVILPIKAGTYNLRLFAAGTYNLLAASEPITVVSPTLSISAATVAAGATVTASLAGGPAYNGDWVGLYGENGSLSEYKDWRYLNNEQIFPDAGFSNATVTFPAPLTPGTYALRFFASGGYAELATATFRRPVTVSGAGRDRTAPAPDPQRPLLRSPRQRAILPTLTRECPHQSAEQGPLYTAAHLRGLGRARSCRRPGTLSHWTRITATGHRP